MDKKLFSIIIPIYNTQEYIKQCIESVINQKNFNKVELLLIDDGSTDNSGKVCDEYQIRYNNIRVIHKKNEGQAIGRNIGIKEANGEYIIFLDSDDFLSEGALLGLENIIDSTNDSLDIIVNAFYSFINENEIIKRSLNIVQGVHENLEILKEVFYSTSYYIGPWQIVYKKDFIISHDIYFKNKYHEDEIWIPEVIIKARYAYYNDNAFYNNRCYRKDSTTESINIKKLDDKIYILDYISDLSKSNFQFRKLLNLRCSQIIIGLIKEYYIYINMDISLDIYNKIEERLGYLKKSLCKYRIMYFIIKILGIKNTSKLFNIILNNLRKE